MPSFEDEIDITHSKICELEKQLIEMENAIVNMAGEMEEMTKFLKLTQKYLISLAKNQAEITKRVSSWPFIPVPTSPEE